MLAATTDAVDDVNDNLNTPNHFAEYKIAQWRGIEYANMAYIKVTSMEPCSDAKNQTSSYTRHKLGQPWRQCFGETKKWISFGCNFIELDRFVVGIAIIVWNKNSIHSCGIKSAICMNGRIKWRSFIFAIARKNYNHTFLKECNTQSMPLFANTSNSNICTESNSKIASRSIDLNGQFLHIFQRWFTK